MTGGLFSWLWREYLSPHKGWLVVAGVLMAIEGSMLGLLSYMLQPMFDTVFIEKQNGAVWWVAGVILAIFLVRGITSVAQKTILSRISERSSAEIKADLARHLMRLDMSFHQAHPPGVLIERVQGDVTGVNQVWQALITGAGRDTIALISLFAVAISVDWRWTLIALIGVPLMVLPAWIAQGYVRRKARAAREVAADMSTRLDEVFHGITPIKLNGLEDYQAARYEGLIDKRVDVEIKAAMGKALIPGLADVMAGIGFFAVLIYGAREIINEEKTVGEFMSFFTAMAFAFEPLRRIAALSGLWQQAAAGIERIRALFAEEPRLVSPATPTPMVDGPPEIRFEDVHLTYGDAPVLNGLSFTAEAGKTTALVGASGAGKSTVFNALARLVDPSSGRVSVGGTATHDLDLTDLRARISVVTQEALLFDDTLIENILLGRSDVPDPQLDAVLTDAHVSDFLASLPGGHSAPVGPRGSTLSGGQRQRVAIARALLRDTPILLLDEATSALDTKSEAKVQAALDRLAKGRTTLVIAHRLSTVQSADKIVVLAGGRVVEDGTHETLLEKGGTYADLYAMQFAGET